MFVYMQNHGHRQQWGKGPEKQMGVGKRESMGKNSAGTKNMFCRILVPGSQN